MAWGNNGGQTYPQDMISGVNNRNILKVNDVNEDNDAKVAGHFINSSTNANARALKVEGKTELNGEIYTDTQFTFNGEEAHFQADLFAESLFHAEGTATFGTGILVDGNVQADGNLDVDGSATVGPSNAAGQINSGGSPTPTPLR